jgi:hypothetical protein
MNYFDSDMSKSTNMVVCFDWICQPMLKLKTHSGFHDLFLNYQISEELFPFDPQPLVNNSFSF